MLTRKRIIAAISIIAIALVAILVLQASGEEAMPKPRGYFRIELPQKAYVPYESSCPLVIEVADNSKVEVFKNRESKDSCWFNVYYPRLNARLHCTYLPIAGDFERLITETYGFAARHEMKASALKRTFIEDSTRNVFGILYDIEGEAASQMQFFFTDSTSHFFRGSLYFFNTPNSDSVAPVLSYIREDVIHLSQTLRWK